MNWARFNEQKTLPQISRMRLNIPLTELTFNVSLLFTVTNIFNNETWRNGTDMVIRDDWFQRLNDNVMPMSYRVKLTLDDALQRGECNIYFSGECDIEILIKVPIYYIILHSQEKYVDIYNASVFDTHGNASRVTAIVHHNETQSISVYFDKRLRGIYVLKLLFTSCASHEEVFKIPYRDHMFLLATHLRPTRTRVLFPCLDDPRAKATFNISITLDKRYTVLSNANIYGILYEGSRGNMRTIYFNRTSKISTYDIVIVIFDKHLFMNYLMRYKYDKINTFALTVANNVEVYLVNRWPDLWKFKATDILAIPGFPHDAMKKSGLIIFREDAIMYHEGADSFATKVEVARLTATVVVHERLNDWVNPASWLYLWLDESIAMLLGQQAVNEILPELRLLDLFVVQFHQQSLRLDTELINGPIMSTIKTGTSINSLFSFSYYIKAPVILYMLRRTLDISEKTFWRGIQIYLSQNKESDLERFCNAMQNALEEAPHTYIRNFDVLHVMHIWVKQMHHPVVKVIQLEDTSMIIQTKIVAGLYLDYLLLSFTTQSELNFGLTRNRVHGMWIEREGTYIFYQFPNLNQNGWIIVNLQQLGYYRVNYEAENWRKIADYLNSDNYANIHVLNRAQIMDDAFHFSLTGEIDLSIFLNLTNYLSRETDYVAWYPVLKNFEYISGYLPYEDFTVIKEKLKTTLDEFFRKIVFKKGFGDNDLGGCLKREVANWACVFGSFHCKMYAKTSLISVIRGNYQSTLPRWKEWIYCKGLMAADYDTWQKIFNIYLYKDDRMLKYLACPENPFIIMKYMGSINNNRSHIQSLFTRKGIRASIDNFHYIVARHARNNLVLEFILKNLDHVVPSQISKTVALIDIINHVYSREHLDQMDPYVTAQNLQGILFVRKKMHIRFVEITFQNRHFSNLSQ